MNKLVECPNCLGVGEELYNGKFPKTCGTCKGDGMVDKDIAKVYISSLKYYNDEEYDKY
jgi:DnaJ-class molecular chaperone